MGIATVAKHTGFGLMAFLVGLMLYARSVELFNLLADVIALPISRWGPDGFLTVGFVLRATAYLLVVAVVSGALAFLSSRLATRYSLIVSLGALSYFGALSLAGHLHLFAAAEYWREEEFFFVVLPPIVTFLLVRSGWLTRRSSMDRPQAARPLS